MTTVAPSAPAPVAPDASASQGKGESTDPSAFAAEFESALTSLTAAVASPAATVPAATTAASASASASASSSASETTASATLPVPELASAEGAASVLSEVVAVPAVPSGSLAAPLPETPVVPIPTSEVTELAGVSTPDAGVAAPAGTPLSVMSDAAPAVTDDSGDDETAGTDAPAEPEAVLDLLGAAVPAPTQPVVQATSERSSSSESATAVASVSRSATTESAPAPTASAPVDAATPAAPTPPVVAPATPALQAPDEVAAPAAPARAQAPDLVGQLARPLHGLRSFGDGTHIITIRVTPENLGPVAVRAHVSGDSMRIELVAPTEQAREAIKTILPDLRRDLSGSGGQATLDLSSGNQSSGRESAPRDSAPSSRGNDLAASTPATGIRNLSRTDAALDVLA